MADFSTGELAVRLHLRIGGEAWEVEVRRDRPGAGGTRELELHVVAGPDPCRDQTLRFTLTRKQGEIWSFQWEDRFRDMLVRRNGGDFEIWPSAVPIPVQVGFPGSTSPTGESGPASGRSQIRARMPGKVIKVLRARGDRVERGDSLAVIEAMKMQNELKATHPGVIVYCGIRDSQTVAAGELLFEVE
jgi:biotin carboxyl carrier protein